MGRTSESRLPQEVQHVGKDLFEQLEQSGSLLSIQRERNANGYGSVDSNAFPIESVVLIKCLGKVSQTVIDGLHLTAVWSEIVDKDEAEFIYRQPYPQLLFVCEMNRLGSKPDF